MSSATKIYLNQHAKTDHVFDVIQKLMGAEFTQSTSGGRRINKNKTASEENPWHVKFVKNPNNGVELYSTAYFNLYFVDPVGNDYRSMYFFEAYDNEYSDNNEKHLNPDSSAVWGVIGKRLVDFFGGKVLFCDSSDSDNPDNWHVCENPKYYPKTKEESSNERYFRYYNTLFNEPLITSKEILEMETRTRYWTDSDKSLLEYLQKFEAVKELNDELDNKPGSNTAKKVKI